MVLCFLSIYTKSFAVLPAFTLATVFHHLYLHYTVLKPTNSHNLVTVHKVSKTIWELF